MNRIGQNEYDFCITITLTIYVTRYHVIISNYWFICHSAHNTNRDSGSSSISLQSKWVSSCSQFVRLPLFEFFVLHQPFYHLWAAEGNLKTRNRSIHLSVWNWLIKEGTQGNWLRNIETSFNGQFSGIITSDGQHNLSPIITPKPIPTLYNKTHDRRNCG